MGRRALVVINPRGSRADEASDARSVLQAAGLELVEPPCPDAAAGLDALIRAQARGCDAVVLGGGDGTLHAALPALLACGVPLGVLPLGTANDFARSAGIPLEPARAAAAIAAGARRRCDVGFAGDRPFLNTASVGVAATLRADLDRSGKRRLGALVYPLAALRRWQQARTFQARVRADDGAWHRVRTRQLSVANGPSQGGRVVDPDNVVGDGLLAVHAVAAPGVGRLLLAHTALRLRRPSAAPDLLSLRGRCFDLATDPPLEVCADGERVTRTPTRFTIRAAALEVFVPDTAAGRAADDAPVSGWLHDPATIALNQLVAALAEEARAAEDASARLEAGDPLARLLGALARRRRALAELLGVEVEQRGALPAAEDPDAAALAALWSRVRSLVAGDPRRSVLAERAQAERGLAARAREAAATPLPAGAGERVRAIASECERAADALERLCEAELPSP